MKIKYCNAVSVIEAMASPSTAISVKRDGDRYTLTFQSESGTYIMVGGLVETQLRSLAAEICLKV